MTIAQTAMKNSNTNAVIARPGESKQACDNAGNANDDEPEARTHLATRAGHRAPQGKKTVGYRVGPPQERKVMTGQAKARMPKAMAARPRSNTSHQLSAMVRSNAKPANGGLDSMCALVIGRLPQLELICFGAWLLFR